MRQVTFSSASRRDLLSVAIYIAADNPARADSFVDELVAACEGLSLRPERFALIAGFEAKGYRGRPHGNYTIVYRVAPEGVRIFRILHGARDLRKILGS